ncbi:WecB/TagA/CpsF family glycosyltransferase [Mucilaginibacter pallidiroseus]|uniref:WecB/TagA/CpsF family glycosyltransferase n=2 Tax=Mucilaginibacter pallidiroseus TaxID=2599295 RepID=A0A563U8E2_9SPHI|nr:WecB/TagA/CpsF family glycosyltransferase [Mucilaginibacter pallidiroseus]
MNIQTLEIFGYPVFVSRLDQIDLKHKYAINTINQFSYVIAERDPEFKEALMSSDILLPDGVGIVAAAQVLKGEKINKIAGADLHRFLLEKLNAENGSCFYLGASSETLNKIKNRLSGDYPNVNFGSYSPPFKPAFSTEDNDEMVRRVNAFKPDVLFVGMTAPKQEKWVHANKKRLDAKVICSIGAVFDFYAGTVSRPNQFWVKIGLEWFIRLFNEPKRMWRRYLLYGPVFVGEIVKSKLKR